MDYQLRDAHVTGHDEKLWLTLERATNSHAMICCGTSWKGVKRYTLCSTKANPVTFGLFLCVSGYVAEHCVKHWTGGRTRLRRYWRH